jgi:hypothetical protein
MDRTRTLGCRRRGYLCRPFATWALTGQRQESLWLSLGSSM